MGQIGKFRFSLIGLLGIVALAALCSAALSKPSPLWASVLLTGTLAVLVVAILASIYHRGSIRAFWVGFSVCGWAYQILVFDPGLNATIGSRLVTTKWLSYLEQGLPPNPSPAWPPGTAPPMTVWTTGGNPRLVRYMAPPLGPFQTIGHSLITWPAALAGGILARYFYMRRETRPETAEPEKHEGSKAGGGP